MLVDRVIWPVRTLGPGARVAIWTAGCSKHCENCSNQELWTFDKTKDIPVASLYNMVVRCLGDKHADGLTITGGDPLEQLDAFLDFTEMVKPHINDILVYTGYYWQDLEPQLSEDTRARMKRTVSVLIDGPYIHELNDNKAVLIGSTNQNIHFFDEHLIERYKAYLSGERAIENFIGESGLVSVGIHNREEKLT